MILLEYRCEECRAITEEFRESSQRYDPTSCTQCGGVARHVWSSPITDNRSVGRDLRANTTPVTHRKPHDAFSAEKIRTYQRRDRTHQQFGWGKTTGS